jgi:hypothetical protein
MVCFVGAEALVNENAYSKLWVALALALGVLFTSEVTKNIRATQ